MNATLNKVFIFAAGAVIGSAVSWKFAKRKYEQIAREEIDSVKEMYGKKYYEPVGEATEDVPDNVFPTEEEKQEYANIVQNYKEGGSESMEIGTPPYVISYEELGEIEEYDTVSLTYYADGVVADDWGDVIEDIPNVIGEDFSNHYDNADDPDMVYVRNERLKCDYEISRDVRKFSEVNLTDEAHD